MPTPANILLITTDQQRFDTLQCAGNSRIFTPHLDWLCDNGIRYTRAYTDCPVCLPARVTIMNGLHAWRHRTLSNKFVPTSMNEQQTLPAILTRAGYHTRLVGKAHFAPNKRQLMGFHHIEENADFPYPSLHGVGGNEHCPAVDTNDVAHARPTWVVDRSINFLETRDPTKPFFLWTSFNEPHPPLTPCREVLELYRDMEMPEPIAGNWSAELAAMAQPWLAVTYELSMIQRFSPAQLALARRAYYALITQVDYQLGRLFGYLREEMLLENTYIIFTSDHGEMLGDHHMGGKCVPFEGSAHVPMIVKPPAAARDTRHAWRGTTCDTLASLADVLPTCAAIAETGPAGPTDGHDLLAAARGETKRERLFGSCMYMHFLVEGSYKLCHETLSNTRLLFDLASDPDERRNLLGPNPPAVAARLIAALDEHLQQNHLESAAAHDPGVASDATHLPCNVHPGHRLRG